MVPERREVRDSTQPEPAGPAGSRASVLLAQAHRSIARCVGPSGHGGLSLCEMWLMLVHLGAPVRTPVARPLEPQMIDQAVSIHRLGAQLRDFIDLDGAAALDLSAAFDSRRGTPHLRGHFALAQHVDGVTYLYRDVCGVNKLFYVRREDGGVWWSNYWRDLARACGNPRDIFSIPAGHIARLSPGKVTELRQRDALPYGADRDVSNEELVELGARARATLVETFKSIRRWSTGQPIYLTLSGGLDSTGIAVLAREHLGPFTAVTFAVASAADPNGERSEDLHAARQVASELGVALHEVRFTPEQLLSDLDSALVLGQDWREFNVHCAMVNVALARAISAHHRASGEVARPLLLTGDGGNELMIEYSPVVYKEKSYYGLPRVPAGRLRELLVEGLDAGDREVGVYGHFGIDCVQPYILAADAYTQFPAGLLERPGARRTLVEAIFGDRIPSFVYDRRKTRAQEGSLSQGGTLSVCVDAGMDAVALRARFAALLELPANEFSRLIWGGRYRHELGATAVLK